MRVLLHVLLRQPQPTAGPIVARLVDALHARPGAAASSGGLQLAAAAPAPAEGAADAEGVDLARLEARCVCACLAWHAPAVPRESARLVAFCEHARRKGKVDVCSDEGGVRNEAGPLLSFRKQVELAAHGSRREKTEAVKALVEASSHPSQRFTIARAGEGD